MSRKSRIAAVVLVVAAGLTVGLAFSTYWSWGYAEQGPPTKMRPFGLTELLGSPGWVPVEPWVRVLHKRYSSFGGPEVITVVEDERGEICRILGRFDIFQLHQSGPKCSSDAVGWRSDVPQEVRDRFGHEQQWQTIPKIQQVLPPGQPGGRGQGSSSGNR